MGVWHGLARFSARAPKVNDIAKELAMLIAPTGRDLTGIHIWGAENKLADTLSRLACGATLPANLERIGRTEVAPRSRSSWRYLGR